MTPCSLVNTVFAKLRTIAPKIILIFQIFNYFRREVWMLPDLFTVFLRRKFTLIMYVINRKCKGMIL